MERVGWFGGLDGGSSMGFMAADGGGLSSSELDWLSGDSHGCLLQQSTVRWEWGVQLNLQRKQRKPYYEQGECTRRNVFKVFVEKVYPWPIVSSQRLGLRFDLLAPLHDEGNITRRPCCARIICRG